MMQLGRETRRPGAFMLELTAALAILAILMTVVAQTSIWSMRERARQAEHDAALELADNIMQAARARSYEELTPAWAAEQRLKKEWDQLLPDPKLNVKVEAEKTVPARRVTVEIRWGAGPAAPSVQLVGLFSPRSVIAPGGKK